MRSSSLLRGRWRFNLRKPLHFLQLRETGMEIACNEQKGKVTSNLARVNCGNCLLIELAERLNARALELESVELKLSTARAEVRESRQKLWKTRNEARVTWLALQRETALRESLEGKVTQLCNQLDSEQVHSNIECERTNAVVAENASLKLELQELRAELSECQQDYKDAGLSGFTAYRARAARERAKR